MSGQTNAFSMTGKLVTLTGDFLASLSKAQIETSSILRTMINSKLQIASKMAEAIEEAGASNAKGQEISSLFGLAGGIAGTVLAMRSIYGSTQEAIELRALNKSPNLEMTAERTAPPATSAAGETDQLELTATRDASAARPEPELTAEEKQRAKEDITKKWASYNAWGHMAQPLSALLQSAGQFSATPFVQDAARKEAASKTLSALVETASSSQGSTESTLQSEQGLFGSAQEWISRYLQLMLSLSQAH